MLPFHEQTDFEFMPQISRYSDEQVEQLLSELTNVPETHKAPVDLSLMVLGNMVTNLLNSSVAPAQRQAIARSFARRCNRPLTTIPRTKDNEQQYMVTLRQPYREKSPRWSAGDTGSPCSTYCWLWRSAAAIFCRRLANDACRTSILVCQPRWSFQFSGFHQLCTDSLSADLYCRLAAAYALPVGYLRHRGMTLLLIDSEVFTRFHLHLNPVVWELVINPDQNEMARDWQLMFISVPIIFLIEMLFATGAGKAAQPDAPPPLRAPVAGFLYFVYQQPPDLYLGGCQFYRPITMQRANLPLSYPMTARRFLEKHGLLDAQDYQRRLVEQGAPEAVSVQYPLSDLRYRDLGTGYNVLLITVDNLNYSRFEKNMPQLAAFAKESVNFSQHMSSGNSTDSGMFGLFYGISPGYMDGVLSARIPAALITALNQQGYQLGLFSSDGFSSPLYRQALLSDSLPAAKTQSDEQTADQWIGWLDRYALDENRWFSWVSLNGTNIDNSQQQNFARTYGRAAGNVDTQIGRVLDALRKAANGIIRW